VREVGLVITLVVVLAGGVAFGQRWDDVRGPGSERSETGLFVERATFCPTNPVGTQAHVSIIGGGAGREPLLVDIEPGDKDAQELKGNIIERELPIHTPAALIGYGGRVAASSSMTFQGPVPGIAASSCIENTGRRWYFAQGSSDLGANQHLIFYNPFPDEAVVKVSFITKNGIVLKSGLKQVAVSSGQVATVKVNDFILQKPVVGAEVNAIRGRIAAWKVVFSSSPDQPPGVTLTRGASETSERWYLPSGTIGKGYTESISLLNPGDEEALVTISLITDDGPVQPPDLVEIKVRRQSAIKVDLTADSLEKDGAQDVSVLVRSENEVGIVAERTVFYGTGRYLGVTSELGASELSRAWWLDPVADDLDGDEIVLVNPGRERALVDVILLRRTGAEIVKPELTGIRLRAEARLAVDLDDVVGSDGAVAYLVSSSPIVAERIGYSLDDLDSGASMGIPIGLSETG
jgi:hypothetical protein